MQRAPAPGLRRFAILLVPLLMLACSKEEPPPAEETVRGAKRKPGEKKGQSKEAPAVVAEPVAPLVAVTPPQSMQMRDGAPIIFAQFAGGVVVPIAVRRSNTWAVEDVQTLDKMPEGTRGKDAHPDVLVEWWKRLDVQAGDTFTLRGDRGAEGTLKVKHEFASADRGGCVGLVWAIPGEVKWTVKPKGSTQGSSEDGPSEHVWALRGTWAPRSGNLARDLTKEETEAAKLALAKARETARNAAGALPEGATWQECDSLSENPCKSSRARLQVLDLEGDGVPEAIATYQLRPIAGEGKAIPGLTSVEGRVLLSVTDKGARVIGKWEGGKTGEESLPPTFSGLMDVTGDGRSELIFRRLANETENWEVFQVSPEKPGTWGSILKTQIEGC